MSGYCYTCDKIQKWKSLKGTLKGYMCIKCYTIENCITTIHPQTFRPPVILNEAGWRMGFEVIQDEILPQPQESVGNNNSAKTTVVDNELYKEQLLKHFPNISCS